MLLSDRTDSGVSLPGSLAWASLLLYFGLLSIVVVVLQDFSVRGKNICEVPHSDVLVITYAFVLLSECCVVIQQTM